MTRLGPKIRARAAAGGWVFVVAWLVLSVGGMVLHRDVARGTGDSLIVGVLFALVALSYASVGTVVARRQPGNPLGWLFLAFGGTMTVGIASDTYAVVALLARPGKLPAGPAVAWLADFVISGPGILFGVFVFLFLLFPDGRLPGPRWRSLAWAAGTVSVSLQVLVSLRPGPLPGFPMLANPLGVRILGELGWLEAVLFVALIALLLAAGLSTVLRFRRTDGETRLQLKWFASGAAFLALTVATGPVWWLSESAFAEVMWSVQFALGLATIPVACAVAILRYHLYDIDRIISRTVSYALLSGALAGVYVVAVVLLGRVLAPVTTGTDLAVAAATLGAVAMVAPARQHIQRLVDRRFNRARYDAQREVEAFGARLRNEVDLEEVGADLVAVVVQAIQPSRASLSLQRRSPGTS